MKKIDKLVLKSFWGPFFLTLAVVVFIFLMKLIMVYIEDFVSKDLDLMTFGRLLFFFAIVTIPTALPLATLLSSLMTFGNLGEFFELTALKSAGISFIRTMRPMMVVVIIISFFSFWFNNNIAPWANLKAYSLLYDIKSSKATLNIKEGIFYNDLPGHSIKVDKKEKDGLLRNLVIYKHGNTGMNGGNRQIILAKSGRMYTDKDKTYLVFELNDGNDYQEYANNSSFTGNGTSASGQFVRNSFKHYKLIISLESFGLQRTDEKQFEYHEYMKNLGELSTLTDSLKKDTRNSQLSVANTSRQFFTYEFKEVPTVQVKKAVAGPWIDSLLNKHKITDVSVYQGALSQAQNMLSYAASQQAFLFEKEKTVFRYELESHHKFTQALSCFVMFLIGAPLGAIIKKGGFGLPVLVSIIFFILLYILNITGDKYAKDGLIWVPAGAWMANVVLAPVGLFFMQKARHDSRLFDKDVYIIAFDRFRKRWFPRSPKSEQPAEEPAVPV